jgi:GTPase SAR1 family protein
VTIEVNEYNFVEFIKRADTTKNSIKVSFVGDTGVGKSLILSQLLTFDDRIRYGR